MKLLICGSARCLWDDLAALGPWEGPVMAVNRAGCDLPKEPEHWAIGDPHAVSFLLPARDHRIDDGVLKPVYGGRVHSWRKVPFVTDVWDVMPSGSTSLFAAKIALRMGFDAILAGVPFDASGHYYSAPGIGWDFPVLEDWPEWEAAAPLLKGRVTSMSGRTRDLLGAPC